MRDQRQLHIWNLDPKLPIHYITFVTIKGHLQMSIIACPMMKSFSGENFFKFHRNRASGIRRSTFVILVLTPWRRILKAYPCTEPHLLVYFPSKSVVASLNNPKRQNSQVSKSLANETPHDPIWIKFCIGMVDIRPIRDVITCTDFGNDQLRG